MGSGEAAPTSPRGPFAGREFQARVISAVLLGAIVLFLNTASTVTMIRHYSEDKAAIYGTDIYYLDQIHNARQRKGATE